MTNTNKTTEQGVRILGAACEAWMRLGAQRARRARYVRYTYGDQWSDAVTDGDGMAVTEREQLTIGGREPLSNNLIRRMVKAVVGRYRITAEEGRTESTEAEKSAMERLREMNQLDELDARTLEEFLISGMAVHHLSLERRASGMGVWVDNVSPDRFFINAVSDSRGNDMELVGRLTDMSIGEVLMRFSRGDRQRASRLRALYATLDRTGGGLPAAPGEEDFFHAPAGRCRVIEVWTLEARESLRCHDRAKATMTLRDMSEEEEIRRENRRRRRQGMAQIETRWEVTTIWRCRMLAPDGTVLDEYNSPLRGGEPPFAVKMYPLVDGDVHSLVEDVIDQQRYVNRLITMMDRMMGTAAKGVLLFPRECKLPGHTWKQLASLWADPGGIIPYQPSKLSEPKQVVTPMADIGAKEMLQTQIKLFEDVSGVTDTLMGKSVSGAIGVERYNTEVENASVAIADLLRTYGDFIRRRNRLMDDFLT